MNAKVQVQICVGTACHIMGAADLITIEDLVAEPLRDRVEVKGVSCLGLCKDETYGKPPFVIIDGETLAEATLDKVLNRIERRAERLIDGGTSDVGS
jgi:NADH:ubiquinone oxidoreductase subunit E